MDKSLYFGLLRVILALAIIIPAVIYSTRWYGKKQYGGGKELKVKEALALGANRALYIVEWENVHLLLGVTNQNITLLEIRNSQQSNGEVSQ